jgi:hypothetical protein
MSNTGAISADSHVQEPLTLYRERVPARYRDRTPHIETRDGKTYSIVEGRKPRRLDLAEARLTDEDKEREFRSDRFGGTDIALRVADQKRDGVIAEVLYPEPGPLPLQLARSRLPDGGGAGL